MGKHHFADVTVAVEAKLSLLESHKIADQIENMLAQKFNIHDTTVHVEPDIWNGNWAFGFIGVSSEISLKTGKLNPVITLILIRF